MCGIVGAIGKYYFTNAIDEMNESQIHRGPDDEGIFRDQINKVSLGMRRLSIVDLSNGHQPMSNEDDTIWVVFNGEIFNAPTLRKELIEKGHSFKTASSDTECLLHLYEEFGIKMLDHITGMFAFCIYDTKKSKLLIARDHFGIKPLYYLKNEEGILFSSELKSILRVESQQQIDSKVLSLFFSLRYTTSEQSIYQSINRLPASHYLEIDLKSLELKVNRYWDINFSTSNKIWDRNEATAQLRELLVKSVKSWAMSDVGISSSLSGGIDSGIVTALLSQQVSGKLLTYTLGFEEDLNDKFSDLHIARSIANKYATEHHEIIITENNILEDLVDMVWVLDEPYAGGLPSWYIYKYASVKSKVIFTGSGGDELFGNYGKWKLAEDIFNTPYENINRFFTSRIKNMMSTLPTRFIGLDRKKRWAMNFSNSQDGILYPYYFFNRDIENLFVNSNNNNQYAEHYIRALANNYRNKDDIRNAFFYVDMNMQLPDEFMMMTDRFSMINSIEARTPLLDKSLVEFSASIPQNFRSHRNNLKYLLKDSSADLLTKQVLDGKKRGFEVPINKWLHKDLKIFVDYFLSKEYLIKQSLFNVDFVLKLKNDFYSSKRNSPRMLWIMFCFQLWYEIHIAKKIKSRPQITLEKLIS